MEYGISRLSPKSRYKDIELEFSMNNKTCKYLGFKELYEKLYGINTFNKFRDDLTEEFEVAYFEHTPYKTK